MRRITAVLTMIAVSMLTGGTAAWAHEPDPPGKNTGCCFSFDDSPVNIIFCAVPEACKFERS
jgi:hypothetical protein